MTLITTAFAQGTHSGRPAASSSNLGYYYFETDTTSLFQSTGSAWVQVASVTAAAAAGTSTLVYRYTVAGSDKASIDTGADTPDAGSNVWTNGDVLEVFATLRTDDAGALGATPFFTVNNDGGANYDRQVLRATNATLLGANAIADTGWGFQTHGSGGLTGQTGFVSLTIPNFAGTTFNKVAMLESRVPDSTAANNLVESWAMGWRSTSAITRLKVSAGSTAKFKVGSQLLIYKRTAS